jgi:hypothetical protein
VTWPPRQPSRSQIAGDDLPAYEAIIERARRYYPDPERDAGFFGRLLLAPRMAVHRVLLGGVVRTNPDRGVGYTHADREWIDQVVAVRLGSNAILRLHVPDAVAAGVRPEAIAAIRSGDEKDLTDDECRLTDFIDRVLTGEMTGEAWKALERRMGEAGVVEYANAIIYIGGGIRLHQALGMPEPSDAEIDALVAEFLSGQREPPPDWETRNG